MSKKFFRPAPQTIHDEDESEDDDDDEILDDEDEDEEVDRKRRGADSSGNDRKRSKQSSFFELEAEASDDDDDEEGDINNKDEQMDDEAREIMRQQDRRRAQAGGRFGERSVADISRDIESRHRMQRRTIDRSALYDRSEGDEAGGPEVYTAVAQQSLVPSVSDPSLWMVSCLNGKEHELVVQIMNKCIAMARQNKPLGICGAIAAQTKGKIYIESFSEPAVLEAVQGIRGLLQYTMRLVPIGDMTTVMTVTSNKKPVLKNEWVRMTRGHYKDDLALVKDVKESGLKCIVQCVPRIDLTLADLPPEEARVRRKTVRPPQKFFNPQEIAAVGRQSLSRQRFPGLNLYCDYFESNYYHDGYLLKEMTVGSMIKPCTDENPPTLDELQRFQRRKQRGDEDEDGENEGSKIASSLLDELSELQGKTAVRGDASNPAAGLSIGDTIEVIEGDLVGMRGKLISIDGSTVKLKPNNAAVDLGGTEEIEFLAAQVRKFIAVGAHVKVVDGRYSNETGTVVAVEQLDGESDFTAVILTDVTNKEISVRTSQLRESAEIASGQDKLSGYELYDLVVLSGGGSANEVGVIVRVGREDFSVINNHGIVREVRPEELRGKRNSMSSRAVALDAQGNQIRGGDTVNVAEGPNKGKTATVKRMSRAQLFLHSQTRSENAGIFVVRSRSCILAGNRGQVQGLMEGGGNSFASGQGQSRGLAGARGRKDDTMIGKTVRIKAGQWKGYLGTVADATPTHYQVELHSRLKKVMVVRERTVVVGDKFGATEENEGVLEGNVIGLAPNTPFMAPGQTPMHGGATPMHGSALDQDGSDEVWRPGGSIDNEGSLKEDGWGTSPNGHFETNVGNNFSEWGTSTFQEGSTWSTAAKKEDATNTFAHSDHDGTGGLIVKREHPTGEIENDVADSEEIPAWFMERVFVETKSSFKRGFIQEILPTRKAVVVLEGGTKETVDVADLIMVQPNEHDTVLVTGGNEIGLEGTLVCVDGNDAILKDANDDFKIVEINFLARVQT